MKELIILELIAFYIALFYALVTLCLKLKNNPDELKITFTVATIFASAMFKEVFNKLIQIKFDYIKSLNLFKRRKKKKVKK